MLLGAGLPILPGLAGEIEVVRRAAVQFSGVGALSEQDDQRRLFASRTRRWRRFDAKALEEVFRLTKGYPYFLQEWGYQSWNLAPTKPITLDVVQKATADSDPRLDQNFFRVRFDRLTPREKNFLRAMAELGPGAQRTSDIATT